jgi:GNAT superfamily N-acetyltransferase
VRLRDAHPDEALGLSRIAYAAKAHWGYPAAELARWREDLTVSAASIERWPTVVAEIDGEAAGFVQVADDTAPWTVEHLWVDPGHMRRGVGRALLAHVLALATRAAVSQVLIDADPHAEAFYLKMGAERIGALCAPIAGEPQRVRPQLRLRVPA